MGRANKGVVQAKQAEALRKRNAKAELKRKRLAEREEAKKKRSLRQVMFTNNITNLQQQKRKYTRRINNNSKNAEEENLTINNVNNNNNRDSLGGHKDARRRNRDDDEDDEEKSDSEASDGEGSLTSDAECDEIENQENETNKKQETATILETTTPKTEFRFHRNRKFNTARTFKTPYASLLANIPRDDLILFSIKPESLRSYMNCEKMVTSRISYSTRKNFPWTVEGLLDFISDPFVAEDLSNKTVGTIISAFKKMFFVTHRTELNTHDSNILREMMKARRNIVPETGRITGAINRERLLQVLEFINTKKNNNNLDAERATLFSDVAILLYTCTLRLFQLLSLTRSSFEKDSNGIYWWVAVPIKGARTEMETKLVDFHENTIKLFEEVMTRRSAQNGSEHDLNVGGVVRARPFFWDFLDKLQHEFSHLMAEAGGALEWPCGHSWQGTHMFRHGGVQDGFKEGRSILAKLRSGHKSDKSLRLYAASDAERSGKLKDLSNQKHSRENFLNVFLEKVSTDADNISQQKNTTVYFVPANFNFTEQEKVQQNLKWTKMVNVWIDFKRDILSKREEFKIDINNPHQADNTRSEKLEHFLIQKFLEINKTMKDLASDVSSEISNINNKLTDISNKVDNNNQKRITAPSSSSASSKVLRNASLNTTYTNAQGDTFLLVKDPNKIVTTQDRLNMRCLNWPLESIMRKHGFFWSTTQQGWIKFIK